LASSKKKRMKTMGTQDIERACIASGYGFAIFRHEPGKGSCIVAAYRSLEEAREDLERVRETYRTEGATFVLREL
jgi:hypothetical protein